MPVLVALSSRWLIGRDTSVTVSLVFAVVQVTTEGAFLVAAEAVCPVAWKPMSARAAATTREEAAARETRRVAIRMTPASTARPAATAASAWAVRS
ncbi:hypothetical protein AB0N16_26100 [Streptomyces sp. NPDC051105]|uniref:hypothetical protein n=1 Tax=Streptomyces sp. NPDC051105 TaxID=3154843 RepID=UPI00343DFAFE